MTSGSPNYPEDPGRDPQGLNPPRDFLTAAEGVQAEGTYTPGRDTETEHAKEPPDEPPTSVSTEGP